jgi:transcriptional regulator with XRE-family HTH domain
MATTDLAGADVARGVTLPGLLAARRRRLLTQERLAARAGVSAVSLYRAERGDAVSFATAQKLADALGVEPRELIESPGTSD